MSKTDFAKGIENLRKRVQETYCSIEQVDKNLKSFKKALREENFKEALREAREIEERVHENE